MCNAHIASRLLHLCYIKWLFICPVRWLPYSLDKSTAKGYLCNQGGTTSHFLACHILKLANKHVITLIPAYLLISMQKLTISLRKDWFKSGTCFLLSSVSSGGGSVCILSYKSTSALLHLGKSFCCFAINPIILSLEQNI